MNIVFVMETALNDMLNECKKHDAESGGILVGVPGYPIIFHAVASGSDAFRTKAHYIQTPKDTAYLQARLDALQNGKKDFIGLFHSHPEGIPWPSYSDLEVTCREKLLDTCYKLKGVIYMVVLERLSKEQSFIPRAFEVSLVNEKISCRNLPFVVVNNVPGKT